MRDGLLEDLRNPARGGGSDAFEAAEEIERLQRVLQVVYDWFGNEAPDWELIEAILNEADRK